MMTFSQRLQAVLVHSGWNQADLCRKTGIATPTVSRWMGESGPIPSEGSLAKIANATGCNLHWLKTGEGEMLSHVSTSFPGDIKAIPTETLIDIYKLDSEVVDVVIEKNRAIPVVKTYDDEETQLHYYCIHCRVWHHHGRGGRKEPYREGKGHFAGDRTAHCFTMNSPYRKHGVILDVVGKFSNVKNQHKNQRALMCPKCRQYYSAAFNACECGYINKASKSKYPEIAKLYQSLLISWHHSQDISIDNQPDSGYFKKLAPKRNTGLSMERHKEIGLELCIIHHQIQNLIVEFSNNYPPTGKMAKAMIHLHRALNELIQVRSWAEENMFVDHLKEATTHIYNPMGTTIKQAAMHEYMAKMALALEELANNKGAPTPRLEEKSSDKAAAG